MISVSVFTNMSYMVSCDIQRIVLFMRLETDRQNGFHLKEEIIP